MEDQDEYFIRFRNYFKLNVFLTLSDKQLSAIQERRNIKLLKLCKNFFYADLFKVKLKEQKHFTRM